MADVKKLSFAKVAASATKDGVKMSTPAPAAATEAGQEHKVQPPAPTTKCNTTVPSKDATGVATVDGMSNSKNVDHVVDKELVDGAKRMKLGQKTPSLIVNGTSSSSTGHPKAHFSPDETSQKADSSSEPGTKPPSLDGKSITSGTTFNALDEKESLRPDDSASVMAAAEDDDAFSFRGSIIANGGGRMGSEVVGRLQRIQLGDMPPRIVSSRHTAPESHSQGIVTPQSTSSEQHPVTDAKIALVSATSTPNGMYGQYPDEKLLEAMQSQKDRLFLLKLEERVIEFVQDSKEPFIDLPPSNSFCRMLTHKLADYYHMTHSFEAVQGAVRIYRTPFCRVPPSLASIAQTASSSSTPPPVMPKKIMRRGENGEFGTSSAGPSKPTSEVGSEAKEKNGMGKEKLSREEREEAYIRARERIFGTASTETSTPENEDGTGVSRASSVSARDKSNNGKKGRIGKQRRDDSESFDSRSQYAPVYGHQQQATWAPQYIPVGNPQYNAQIQQSYPNPMPPPVYAPANQAYPQMMPGNTFVQQYSGMPTYPQQPAPPRYQPSNGPLPPVPYGPSMPTPPQPQQGWQQPAFNQSPYQPRATPVAPPAGIPYAYGTLPANANPNDPKSQHPIPGSFNRHMFNPKTQSFVPTNGMAPMQTPPGTYNGYAPPQQGSPQMTPPRMPYNGYQAGPPPMGQVPYTGNTAGYGMMRQGSNNSLPTYHPSPHSLALAPQLPSQPSPQGPAHHIPNKPAAIHQGPAMHGQTFTNLPTYGNPATLPQKPST